MSDDTEPQRKRGRPKSVRVPTEKEAKGILVQFVAMANFGASFVFPKHWNEQDGTQLTTEETTQLVEVTYLELKELGWLSWLLALQAASIHTQFAFTITMLALPRLAKWGVLPDNFAQAVAAVGVEAGPAPIDHRTDRNGQELGGGAHLASSEPLSDSSDRGRPGNEVRHRRSGTNGQGSVGPVQTEDSVEAAIRETGGGLP